MVDQQLAKVRARQRAVEAHVFGVAGRQQYVLAAEMRHRTLLHLGRVRHHEPPLDPRHVALGALPEPRVLELEVAVAREARPHMNRTKHSLVAAVAQQLA